MAERIIRYFVREQVIPQIGWIGGFSFHKAKYGKSPIRIGKCQLKDFANRF